MKKIIFTILLALTACAPSADQTAASAPQSSEGHSPQVVKVHTTDITQPWLAEVYACAEKSQTILAYVPDSQDADIAIRLGEPEEFTSLAYQIDHDDLLVVTSRESPVQNLKFEDVRSLFSNPGSQVVDVWVFSSSEDIQQIFNREIMQESTISTLARLALSPQQMSDRLNNDKNSVGILTRHWKTGNVREVFTLTNMPVLALTKSEPQDMVKELLACLQK